MRPWRFLEYHTEDGRCPIREWYASQDEAVQAAFDGTLHRLRAVDDWSPKKVKEFELLEREHAGLGTIRFSVSARHAGTGKPYKRRFRPAGVWRPESRDFILLVGCEKTGEPHKSHAAFTTALCYKELLEQGKGSIHEHLERHLG